MRTEREARVALVGAAPGPAGLMARAYAASAAALLLRTHLVVLVALGPLLTGGVIAHAYFTYALPVGVVMVMLSFGLAVWAPAFALVALAWVVVTGVRRAVKPSLVWVATRGWSTAAVWAEYDRATDGLYARFWGAFPSGVGGVAARAFLDHVDEHGLTVGAHARTKRLAARYKRAGFVETDEKDVLGRRLLLRPPQ